MTIRRNPFLVFAAAILGLALAAGLTTQPAHAVSPDEILSDAALEKRAREISLGLRCLVCQNQSIDDSDAPLARDLRILVRERLVAGDTDQQVEDFLVARYGEFVLLKPPLSAKTVLLWLMPLLALAIAVVVLRTSFRPATRGGSAAAADLGRKLSAEEQARLDALLAKGGEDGRPADKT